MASLEEAMISALFAGNLGQDQIAASDPYLVAKQAPDLVSQIVLQSAANPEFSTTDKIIAGAVSGLLSGGLGHLSGDYQQRAGTAYRDVLFGGIGGSLPERPNVLSPAIYGDAATKADVFKKQALITGALAERNANLESDQKIEEKAAEAIFNEPRRATEILAARDLLLNRKKPVGVPVEESSAVTVSTPSVGALPPSSEAAATFGPKSYKVDPAARYNELLPQMGYDDEAVRQRLKKEYEDESRVAAEAEDYLATQRDALSKSFSTLNDLKNALDKAGDTGGVVLDYLPDEETGRKIGLYTRRAFGSEEAAKRLEGRKDLDSLAVNAAGEIRRLFPGQTSEKEFLKYLEATIGLKKSKGENKAIFDRLSRAYTVAKQRTDFLTTAKNQGYSLADAEAMYGDLENAIPTFRDGDINPERLSLSVRDIPLNRLAAGEFQGPAAPADGGEGAGGAGAAAQPMALKAEEPESSFGEDALEWARGVAGAGAKFGNTALFGLPRQAVAALDTVTGETLDAFGVGAGRSFGENYRASLAEQDAAVGQAEQESPVLVGGADIAGTIFSPVNKLKAVQSIFKAPGVAGVAKRAAASVGMGAASDIAEGKMPSGERLENVALFSTLFDVASKGASKLVKPAEGILRRMTGLTTENYRAAAKGLDKSSVIEAKQRFQNAINIVRKEHGIKTTDLMAADDSVMQDLASKAADSIKVRGQAVDGLIDEATAIMGSTRGAKGKFVAKTPISLNMGTMANLQKAIKRAGAANGPEVREEAVKILAQFKANLKGKPVTLSALQAEKKSLNPFYKTEGAYKDAVSALGDDFRAIIERETKKLVTSGRFPAGKQEAIKKLNYEMGDLMKLRDAYVKRLPGAMAQDVLSKTGQALGTTAGAGLQGASNLGSSIAGESGKLAAMASALAAYSKRIGRPAANLLASGQVSDFLSSPEFRSSMIKLDQMSREGGEEDVEFGGFYFTPDREKTRSLFEKKNSMSEERPASIPDRSKLYEAMIRQESNNDPKAVSSKGARGLMQIMPDTAKEIAGELGVDSYDLEDPETNKRFGEHYINKMLRKFGDLKLALAAYNMGPGALQNAIDKFGTRDWDIISKRLKDKKAYLETVDYVPAILKKMESA